LFHLHSVDCTMFSFGILWLALALFCFSHRW
jgi:hypothetical protein